jgi:uncharacterized protein (TIGR02466 family)
MKRYDLYPIPLWYDTLPISDIETHEAVIFCEEIRQRHPEGVNVSNVGGWQSDKFRYNSIIGTPLHVYFKRIKERIDKILLELGSSGKSELQTVWININKKHNYNISHVHPGSTLSGVFYLTKNNSEIIFKRPVDANTAFLFGIRSYQNTTLSYTYTPFTPDANHLIIFPAWLEHRVEPSESNENRISIAFNIGISNIV